MEDSAFIQYLRLFDELRYYNPYSDIGWKDWDEYEKLFYPKRLEILTKIAIALCEPLREMTYDIYCDPHSHSLFYSRRILQDSEVDETV